MINATGYVQVGNSRLPVTSVEFEHTLCPPYGYNLSSFRETVQTLQSWNVAMTIPLEYIQRDLFYKLIHEMFALCKPDKPSKQTRAWYRVRARAQHRKKFEVHSHRRWDAHPYYGREKHL